MKEFSVRFSCFFVFLILAISSYAQTERVYLQTDKYTGRPGDTLWFKAYIFRGKLPTRYSTNLYVDLFTEKGKRLSG
jgi:hypothetical protein